MYGVMAFTKDNLSLSNGSNSIKKGSSQHRYNDNK